MMIFENKSNILCQILNKSLIQSEILVYMMKGLIYLIFPKENNVSVLKMKYNTVLVPL